MATILGCDLHFGTTYNALDDAIWAWGGQDGKYEGCRYWSAGAIEAYTGPETRRLLCHEHSVPKRVLIELLCGLPAPTPATIHRVMERLCIGCVLLRAEHKRLDRGLRSSMPAEFDDPSVDMLARDPWLRYRSAGISVCLCESGKSPPALLERLF